MRWWRCCWRTPGRRGRRNAPSGASPALPLRSLTSCICSGRAGGSGRTLCGAPLASRPRNPCCSSGSRPVSWSTRKLCADFPAASPPSCRTCFRSRLARSRTFRSVTEELKTKLEFGLNKIIEFKEKPNMLIGCQILLVIYIFKKFFNSSQEMLIFD